MAGSRKGVDLDHGMMADLVSYWVRLVQIAAFKDFEEVTRSFGNAPRYFGLLSLIESNPGTPQGKLAHAIHLLRSSIVPILDRLVEDGLIERRLSPVDRRTKSIWLTPHGKKVVSRLKPLVRQHEERMLAGFSPQEKEQFLQLLKRVDANLGAKHKTAATA